MAQRITELRKREYTIYALQCAVNKRIYIGATSNLQNRIYQHYSDMRRGYHSNALLTEDFNKYGESAFKHYVLESGLKYDEHKEAEQRYIEQYRTRNDEFGYNKKHHRSKRMFKIENGLPEQSFKGELNG